MNKESTLIFRSSLGLFLARSILWGGACFLAVKASHTMWSWFSMIAILWAIERIRTIDEREAFQQAIKLMESEGVITIHTDRARELVKELNND